MQKTLFAKFLHIFLCLLCLALLSIQKHLNDLSEVSVDDYQNFNQNLLVPLAIPMDRSEDGRIELVRLF